MYYNFFTKLVTTLHQSVQYLKVIRNSPVRSFLIYACSFVIPLILLRVIDEFSKHTKTRPNLNEMAHNRKNMDLIFIGGVHRSGTTLMRAMLDAYPGIRCGPETAILLGILNYRNSLSSNSEIVSRLSKTGIFPEILDEAEAQFILELIIRHGAAADRYCNKDPFQMTSTKYLHSLFPNSKFVLMLRDGRAMAHSIVSGRLHIKPYNADSYRDTLKIWNKEIQNMYSQCIQLGDEICMQIHYEQLILQPIATTKKLFKFLGMPWSRVVLEHEKHMNETKTSRSEVSTRQVKKPLYLKGLSEWFGKLPKDVERDIEDIAPMLKLLGYDPNDPTPKYGEPDDFVKEKMQEEQKRGGKE